MRALCFLPSDSPCKRKLGKLWAMAWIVLSALGGAFLLALIATWAVRALSRRIGFLDKPGGHKAHANPVALGGGVAIFTAMWLPVIVGTLIASTLHANPPEWVPELIRRHLDGIASKLPMALGLAAGATILHVVGLVDDRRPLGPGPKFVVQGLVALAVAWLLDVRVMEALPAPISIALTVVWIVAITNAFNFLDNMDGLSAGVGAIAAAVFAVAAMNAGQVFVPIMAWVAAGALMGFLIFNFAPATIFMGDAGSLVIGYTLSVLTILTTYYDPDQGLLPLGVLVPLVVLAVPIYDAISVIVRRIRIGQSPFVGDRQHFSHRLVDRGMRPSRAVLTIYLATAATALPAVVLPRLHWAEALLLLVQCVCVVIMIAVLEAGGRTRPA